MKLLRVLGLGLAIVMLKFLAPRIFAGVEATLLAFFDAMQKILALSATNVASVTESGF